MMRIKANDYSPDELIRIIREWSELNQYDFGKSINRSKGAVKKYESGERDFSFQTFIKICQKHDIIVTLEKKSRIKK